MGACKKGREKCRAHSGVAITGNRKLANTSNPAAMVAMEVGAPMIEYVQPNR